MKKILILLIFAMSLFGKETSSLTYGLGLGFISAPSYIGSKKEQIFFYPFLILNIKVIKLLSIEMKSIVIISKHKKVKCNLV